MTLDIGFGNEEKDCDNLPKFDEDELVKARGSIMAKAEDRPLLTQEYDANEVSNAIKEPEEPEAVKEPEESEALLGSSTAANEDEDESKKE